MNKNRSIRNHSRPAHPPSLKLLGKDPQHPCAPRSKVLCDVEVGNEDLCNNPSFDGNNQNVGSLTSFRASADMDGRGLILERTPLGCCPNMGPWSPKTAQLLYYYRPLLLPPSLNPLSPATPGTSPEKNRIEAETDLLKISDNKKHDSECRAPKPEGPIRDYVIKDLPTGVKKESGDIEHLRFNASEVFADTQKRARDRYELNWLNFNELYCNRYCLDPRTQNLLLRYLRSKWDNVSWLENGLKTTNGTLAQGVLFLIAAEAWDIIPNSYMIIEANLRSKDGNYSPNGGKRRFISPRAARAYIKGFKNRYAPERLFPKHHAYLVLFESPQELRMVGHNPSLRRADYDTFFERNRSILKDWKKKKKIRAYFLSNEITCLSIVGQIFNPHSHAVIWVDSESDASFIDEYTENGHLIKYYDEPRTQWSDLKNYLYYMMRAHSLAAVYEREFDKDAPVTFNKAAVNALRALVELQCGDGGGKGRQKNFQEGIPLQKGNNKRAGLRKS